MVKSFVPDYRIMTIFCITNYHLYFVQNRVVKLNRKAKISQKIIPVLIGPIPVLGMKVERDMRVITGFFLNLSTTIPKKGLESYQLIWLLIGLS